MTVFVIAGALVMALLFGGHTGTTVVLLPDEDGKVGAVSVKTEAGEQTLDKAYHYVTAGAGYSPPSKMQEMGASRVNDEFRDVLKAQPAKPLSFILYFDTGSTELTNDSQATIPQLLEAIRERAPTEVSIIGHTDTTGSEEINARVSFERAKAVEKILKGRFPELDHVELQYFGEHDLLIPTPPNTPEPRNRRVEVMIL